LHVDVIYADLIITGLEKNLNYFAKERNIQIYRLIKADYQRISPSKPHVAANTVKRNNNNNNNNKFDNFLRLIRKQAIKFAARYHILRISVYTLQAARMNQSFLQPLN